jgi:hypothetical protein
MESDILFEVSTPLGFRVRVTRGYWEFVVAMKHPVMRERVPRCKTSWSDPAMFLFYRAEVPGRWVCAVAKRLNDTGFLLEKLAAGKR